MADKTAAQDPIWGVWRAVTRALSMRGMLWESFAAPSVWGMIGIDYISGLRRNASTQKVVDILSSLSAHDLRRVHALAQINHHRHEAISRWTAVGMLTVPVSAALVLSEIAPGLLDRLRRSYEAGGWAALVGSALAVVAFYLLAAWRARQVATVVELALVERGVLADGDTELQPGLEPPLGA